MRAYHFVGKMLFYPEQIWCIFYHFLQCFLQNKCISFALFSLLSTKGIVALLIACKKVNLCICNWTLPIVQWRLSFGGHVQIRDVCVPTCRPFLAGLQPDNSSCALLKR